MLTLSRMGGVVEDTAKWTRIERMKESKFVAQVGIVGEPMGPIMDLEYKPPSHHNLVGHLGFFIWF